MTMHTRIMVFGIVFFESIGFWQRGQQIVECWKGVLAHIIQLTYGVAIPYCAILLICCHMGGHSILCYMDHLEFPKRLRNLLSISRFPSFLRIAFCTVICIQFQEWWIWKISENPDLIFVQGWIVLCACRVQKFSGMIYSVMNNLRDWYIRMPKDQFISYFHVCHIFHIQKPKIIGVSIFKNTTKHRKISYYP